MWAMLDTSSDKNEQRGSGCRDDCLQGSSICLNRLHWDQRWHLMVVFSSL